MNKYYMSIRHILLFLLIIYFGKDVSAQIDPPGGLSDLFRKHQSSDYVPDMDDGNSVAFRDINGDGLPDIYLTCYKGNNYLLLNSGAYRPFKDVTQISGLSGNLRPDGVYNFESGRTTFDLKIGSIIIDIDNDEDGDILVSGRGISTSLYRNNGQLNFENITNHLDIYPPIEANAAISADINNDRSLDLFITDEKKSNRMLLNLGDGYFEDVTENAGLLTTGSCTGAAFSDIDRDGDQDLYVCREMLPDLLYKNLGDGKFEPVLILLPTLTDSLKTQSATFADLDNDADFDMIVTHDGGSNFLFYNNTLIGDTLWVFSDESAKLPGNLPYSSMGSVVADFNNDGFQDIYITNNGPNWLYINHGQNLFTKLIDHEEENQDTDVILSRGVASADFNLDGNIDLFIANRNAPGLLYMNILDQDNYIKFHLIGIQSNKDAIGARIEIYQSGYLGDEDHLLGTREISAGSGYYSFNEPVVHFGLDTLRQVDVRLIFPSGQIVEENALTAGSTYTIYENGLVSRTLIIAGQNLYALMQMPSFWYQVVLVVIFFALIFLFVRLGLQRYRWSARTASGYLIGFFLLALIALLALNKLGLLYTFSIIDLLTLVFVVIFFFNSERLYRLRIIRERYRSVLINLSNQIVNIHDNQKLFETVIKNITSNTEFDKVAVLPLDTKKVQFMEASLFGLILSVDELNNISNKTKLIESLHARKHLQKSDLREFRDFNSFLSSMLLISIERDDTVFGILSLGTDKTISPLTQEEIDLFVSLGNQMAIAMENNDYIKRSTEMVKKLTEAEVREKYLKELETANAILDSKNRDLQKLYDELKNTQAQLIHSEKMASLGQLVAGISHELNNPIAFIYANIKQLKSYTDKIENFTNSLTAQKNHTQSKLSGEKKISAILPDLKNLIDDTIHGSQMVKTLVENLRKFSHIDQAQWKTVDIHDGIESSLMILKPEIKNRINVEKKYKAIKMIDCNPGQINQVFMNLLSNAAQAIDGEGKITIETREDDKNMYIHITDSGIGIPQKNIDKIFDPFFTTKDVGKGTGLGLSISYSIIKNHGGSIDIQSEPGRGSTFSVTLPFASVEDAAIN